jgi:hypothetical protein
MAPQFTTSDDDHMAAESDSDLSCTRDEVSVAEEVHSFHISIDIKVVLGEIVSNIGTTDRQWDEE